MAQFHLIASSGFTSVALCFSSLSGKFQKDQISRQAQYRSSHQSRRCCVTCVRGGVVLPTKRKKSSDATCSSHILRSLVVEYKRLKKVLSGTGHSNRFGRFHETQTVGIHLSYENRVLGPFVGGDMVIGPSHVTDGFHVDQYFGIHHVEYMPWLLHCTKPHEVFKKSA